MESACGVETDRAWTDLMNRFVEKKGFAQHDVEG